MEDIHRRIELQDQEDLRYLINNVLRVANENIDKILPPVVQDDPLRPRVQELVHEYIRQTFTTASPNLLINGHAPNPVFLASLLASINPTSSSASNPSNPEIEEYLPQNGKLITKLTDLTAQAQALDLELAELRRSAPEKIVEAHKERYQRGIETDEGVMKSSVEIGVEGGRDREGIDLGIGALERQEDVEGTWRGGVEGLGKLKREMGGTAARMEGARKAGEWVLTSK